MIRTYSFLSRRMPLRFSMQIKDGTATVLEEEIVNYFSTQRNSAKMKNIARYVTNAFYFANSTTALAAHYNSKTIEITIVKGRKGLFYAFLQVNINKEHQSWIIKEKINLFKFIPKSSMDKCFPKIYTTEWISTEQIAFSI